MNTHFVARKIRAGKSSYRPGRVVDATGWTNRSRLVSAGNLEPLPRDAAVYTVADGTSWLEGYGPGLAKAEKPQPDPAPEPQQEEAETYPVYMPVGRWRFSNGEVLRMKKVDAIAYEEGLE